MDDTELDEIRKKRMAALKEKMAQADVSGGVIVGRSAAYRGAP